MNYNWNWFIYFESTGFAEGEIYLYWFGYGLVWTIGLALSSWIIAVLMGTMFGIVRTLKNPVSAVATIYVEIFRNVPLLVQLFIWYYIVPDWLPESVENWFKRELDPAVSAFITVVICLGLFTGARVCEQVRTGIQSLPVGQSDAAMALGFSLFQTYRFVLLPQAFRIIIPPMTSEFLNIFKNSSVASLVGLMELLNQANQVAQFTANIFEALTLATLIYLTMNLSIMWIMIKVEARIRRVV